MVSTPCWLAAYDAGSGFKNYIKLTQHQSTQWVGTASPGRSVANAARAGAAATLQPTSLSLGVYLYGIALSLALLPALINLNGRPQLKHAQRVRRSSYGKVRGQS